MNNDETQRTQDWANFLDAQIDKSLDGYVFYRAVEQHARDSPIDGLSILAAWASLRSTAFRRVSPTHLRILELLSCLYTDIDVIHYTAKRIAAIVRSPEAYIYKPNKLKGEWIEPVEAAMLERAAWRMVNLRDKDATPDDRVPAVQILKPLITLVHTFNVCVTERGGAHGPSLAIGIELGKYLFAYMHELAQIELTISDNGRPPKAFRRLFGQYLPPFINLLVAVQPDVATSLSSLQAELGLLDIEIAEHVDEGLANDLHALTYHENVMDNPVLPTRAALYIWLNAMARMSPRS